MQGIGNLGRTINLYNVGALADNNNYVSTPTLLYMKVDHLNIT